jgi:oligopeptide transport system ATP-binding protein
MLKLERIGVDFKTGRSQKRAVDEVSLHLNSGEIVGIVGESGSGKSTLARVMMGLQQPSRGRVLWQVNEQVWKDYQHFSQADWQSFRQQVQLIFQDPLDALNPRMSMGEIVTEPLKNLGVRSAEQQQRLATVLDAVGLSRQSVDRYPHEFSGGQCQRIGIARAMIMQPNILICDEPVSALDVSIQAQVINLLKSLQQETRISLVFISHDLSIVRHLCHRTLVLQQGKLVESGDTETLFTAPQQVYTQRLLGAIPKIDPQEEYERVRSSSSATGKFCYE